MVANMYDALLVNKSHVGNNENNRNGNDRADSM